MISLPQSGEIQRIDGRCALRTQCVVLFLLVASLLVISPVNVSGKGTSVYGGITSDTTWDLSGSPYYVESNITIVSGVTLTVDAGVEVKFNGFYEIAVNGFLRSVGTSLNMINYTSNKSSPAIGDWWRLFVNDTGEADISYCSIEFANAAIYLSFSEYTNITNNALTNNTHGITIYPYSDQTTIANNTISYNEQGGIALNTPSMEHVYESRIIGNTVSNNGGTGVYLSYSANLTILDNTIEGNEFTGLLFSNSPNNMVSNNNISNNRNGIIIYSSEYNDLNDNQMWNNTGWGLHVYTNRVTWDAEDYNSSIPTSNTVNGRPIYYFFNKRDYLIEQSDAGHITVAVGDNVTVRNSVVTNGDPIRFVDVTNSTIRDSNSSRNFIGILLEYSSNCTISGNNASINRHSGIALSHSHYNNVTDNGVTLNDRYGIRLDYSTNNTITNNTVVSTNRTGISLFSWAGVYSSDNYVYHNDIVNNQYPAYDNFGGNYWDLGYPYGGNYWSDYTGVDLNSGPNQDILGSDDIGDVPYDIDPNNVDRYPLMKPVKWSPPQSNLLTMGSVDKAPSVVNPGQNNVMMLQLDFSVDSGSANLTELALDLSGTGLDSDVSGVRLVDDKDDSGGFSPGDAQLGADRVFSSGSLVIDGFSFNIGFGAPESLLVLYNISSTAGEGNTVGARVENESYLKVDPPDTVDAFMAIQSTNSLINTVPQAYDLKVQGFPDGSTEILHIIEDLPILSWSYTDSDSHIQDRYEVRVGTNTGIGDMWYPIIQIGGSTSIGYAGLGLTDCTDYWFGVRVNDGYVWSSWAEVKFHMNTPPPAPVEPVSPANGASVTATSAQTVAWTSGGADCDGDSMAYTWDVATDSSFSTIIASGSSGSPTSSAFITTPSTTYYWRVNASDGFENSTYGNMPTGYWTFSTTTIFNNPPVLNWTGETNYEEDGLHPGSGNETTDFVFRIEYSDGDNDPPSAMQLHILRSGIEISGSPFSMLETDTLDTNHIDGKVYLYDIILDEGDDYSYYFSASDGLASAQTAELDGPVVEIPIGTVLGRVTDKGGNPVQGAKVEMIDSTGSTIGEILTNTSGDFRFDEVPPGVYSIVASKDGFKETRQQDITVQEGENHMNLVLEPHKTTPIEDFWWVIVVVATVIIVFLVLLLARRRKASADGDEPVVQEELDDQMLEE